MELSNTDDSLYPFPDRTKLISLYLAHRPGLQMTADFAWVKINGNIVRDELKQSELPGRQGWSVDLGFLGEGKLISLEWELRTKSTPPETHVNVGVFRNGALRQRTELVKGLVLAPYEGYLGTGTFTV